MICNQKAIAPVVPKVVAYITRNDQLLVFRHRDFPAPGIQVPAGSLEPGEDPAIGVVREAHEETGIEGLQIVRYLGCSWRDMRPRVNQIHNRHWFHLSTNSDLPEEWLHWEVDRSDGSPEPLAFCFFWLPVRNAERRLIAGQGDFIWKLRPELCRSSA